MSSESNTNIVTMVDRACQLLEHLSKQDGSASISQIAKEMDLPKATVYRLLYTMQQRKIIEKEPGSDLYKLGIKLIEYAEKVRYDSSLVDQAKSLMKITAQATGESINIGIRHEDEVVTLHSEEGEKSILVSRLIPVADLYCSSMGKLYLAQMSDEMLTQYFSAKLHKRTVNTLTSLHQFILQRDEILSTNLALDNEEYEYGLSCIAAPLFNSAGDMIGSISISGPTSRLEFKGLSTLKKALLQLKTDIEERLI